jgi:NADPH-dependent ferric siderophore reductase
MTQQEQPVRQRPRPTFRTVQVNRLERLTPKMVRVTFQGDELEGFTPHGPAEHIRIWFPFPGEERPVMPAWGPNGPELAPGQQRPISRVYTPRRWDAVSGELDVDFALHREGPGTNWAAQARPGNTVVIAGPGGSYTVDHEAAWYLLAGDQAALPAIQTILAELPSTALAYVYVEVDGPAEHQRLETRASAIVTWVHTDADAATPGRALESAFTGMALPPGRGRVFVACEAGVMRDVRKHLLYERKLDRGMVYTHGYWKQGEANHPDHDLGEDV